MADAEYIPVISDPNYTGSVWFERITKGISLSAAASREKLPIKVFSTELGQINFEDMPDVVVITNGLQEYVHSAVKALQRAGKQIILTGLEADYLGDLASCVTTNHRLDMESMIQYLVGHGKRRIALVGFREGAINDSNYRRAAISAARSLGAPIGEKSVFIWNNMLEDTLNEFVRASGSYDVAVCPNDSIALSLVNVCKAAGIDIPGDMFVTGTCDMLIGRYCDPSLTTIQIDFEKIGYETFNVWNFIRKRLYARALLKVMIPGKLVARTSTAFLEVPPQLHNKPTEEFSSDAYQKKVFFTDPLIQSMIRIENCLSNRDELDRKIILGIMQGKSYETLSEELFVSVSAISYRRVKIFKDADVSTRAAFELLMHDNIGDMSTDILHG